MKLFKLLAYNLWIIFLTFTFSNVLAQDNSDIDKVDLFDKNYMQAMVRVKCVKTYKLTNINVFKKMPKGKGQLIEERYYDSLGRPTKIKILEENSSEFENYQFKYVSKGPYSLIKTNKSGNKDYEWFFTKDTLVYREVKYVNGGKRKYSWEYTYNDDLEVTSLKKLNKSGKPVRERINTYDDLGRLVELKFFQPINKLKSSGKISYIDTTHNVEEFKIFENQTLKSFDTYKYNEQDQLIRINNYNHLGEVFSTQIFEYDDLKRTSKKVLVDRTGDIIQAASYRYNSDDKLTHINLEIGDYLIQNIENEYDAFGNIKFQKTISSQAGGKSYELITYYEYNDNGHLIEQRSENLDAKLRHITKVEYDYYE